MNYFGEYLVAKGIVSIEALVEALVEQIQTVPSVAEIIFKNKALPAKSMLQAFAMQHQKQIDFREACRNLKLWSPELDLLIVRELAEVRVPLGQILIKKGLADLTTITKALDEYLSRIETPPENTVSPPENTGPRSGEMDPILLEEYLQNLSDEVLERMIDQFELLKISAEEGVTEGQRMDRIKTDLHFIRGLMRCVQIQKMEGLVAQLETCCLNLKCAPEFSPGPGVPSFAELGVACIGMIREFNADLVNSCSEEHWFKKETNTARFDSLLTNITKACDLSGADQ